METEVLVVNCPSCGTENPAEATFCRACNTRLGTPTIEAPAPLDDMTPSTSFVGRRQELGELRTALDDTLSGKGRLAMLVGEPGIGKTRTAQELATYAEDKGVQVLWGRCYEEEGAPPYWPWMRLLRAYIQVTDPEHLQSAMGVGAADIAEIVPEVQEKLPGLGPPPSLEPEQARFRLFDSITTFLKNVAQSQPLMLVLDDLHWADHSSLLLLEFLSQEIATSPLLILGTYRDVEVSRRHPLSQTLGNLIRQQDFLRIQLHGLTQGEVGQLLQVSIPVSAVPPLVETIYGRTEGNPLFVNEVIRVLHQGGTENLPLASIPEGIKDAIGRRLNRLSEGCNQVLTLASVVGREFDFRVLEALSRDIPEEELLALVDEGLEAHAIEELPQAVGRYQFTHALIQETLTEELTMTRRVRLHARIAETLEDLYGDDAESHAAELAHHFAEAEAVLGTEKLVLYSLLAGKRALATYAYEEALTHFERGLAARGIPRAGAHSAPDWEAAALLFGLGRAQAATAERRQRPQAVATMQRAFDYYAEAGDVDRAVAVAEDPLLYAGVGGAGASQVGARALSMVPPDSYAAGRLLCNYGLTSYHETADYQEAREAFARAIAIARHEGDTAMEARTLGNASHVDADELRWEESLEKAMEAIHLASQANDPAAEFMGQRTAFEALRAMGDFEGAGIHAEAALALAESLGQPEQLGRAFYNTIVSAQQAGDWLAARTISDRGLEVAPQNAFLLACRIRLEYEDGDFNLGEAYLDRLVQAMGRVTPGANQHYALSALVIAEISRITGDTHRFKVADKAAEIVLSSPYAVPRFSMCARTSLALMAIQRGAITAAAEQYSILEPARGTLLALDMGTIDRRLGLLAHTIGNLDQATAHFEDALDFCRKAGYRPELAWTCCDYAGTLLQRDSPGDREQAMSLLDESLEISTNLGMRPLMERVIALQEQVQAQPARGPAYPDSLTEREVEVLRLLATGLTDRQIAETLVIAESTARRHISNIYAKRACPIDNSWVGFDSLGWASVQVHPSLGASGELMGRQ